MNEIPYECRALFALLERAVIFRRGILLINKKELIFKSHGYNPEIVQKVLVREITSQAKEKRGNNNYIRINNSSGEAYALCALTSTRKWKFNPDDDKTNRVYSLLRNLRIEDQRQKIVEPLKKMMQVSTRININLLKETLGIDSSIFYQNIFNLASELGLIIDGDSLKVDNVSDTNFIRALNKYMNLGIFDELLMENQLFCRYCGSSIKPNVVYCTECGTSLSKDDDNKDIE